MNRRLQLAKGQVWKTDQTYIHIVERGNKLIQYKALRKLGQRAVRTQVSSSKDVETYLRVNHGKLLESDIPGNGAS